MAHDRSSFPFFEMARELRNMVYEYSTVDLRRVYTLEEKQEHYDEQAPEAGDEKVRLYLRNGPHVPLLLVNRQFKHEYSEQVEKVAHLSIQDHESRFFWLPHIPREVRQYPLRELLLCCSANDVSTWEDYVAGTIEREAARSLVIKIYVEREYPELSVRDLQMDCVELITYEAIERLELHSFSPSQSDIEGGRGALPGEVGLHHVHKLFRQDRVGLCHWTKEGGWVTTYENSQAEDVESDDGDEEEEVESDEEEVREGEDNQAEVTGDDR